MPFTQTPSELIASTQDVLIGDLQVRAFSRVARINGLTAGLLTDAPPLTFVSNLLAVEAPVRNWSLETFAGEGLSIAMEEVGGNAPTVAGRNVQQYETPDTGHTWHYPSPRRIGQLLIMAVATSALTTVSGLGTWTTVASQAGTESRLIIMSKLLDGSEPGTELLAFGTSSGAVVRTWVIDGAEGTVEAVSGINDSAAGTSLDLGTISPSWAVATPLNTTYLAILALADDTTVTVFPAGYATTGQDANVSATADIDCTLAYAETSTLGSSENPGAFTYGASRSLGYVLAIRAASAGRMNWDGLLVRKTSVDVGTQRALNVIEGSGISLTVTDNPGAGQVDVVIEALPGGGAGWDDVLLVDAHTGATDPIIDDAQFIQFGIAAPPASGQIRTNEPWLAHGDKDMDITAGEGITLDAVDSILIDSAAGSIDLISGTGSIELDADTNVIFTVGGAERFRMSDDGAFGISGAVFGSAGQVFTSQGPATPPLWTTIIGVVDGDKGDITISSLGTVYTIDNDVVTYAKIQNVVNNNRFLGRISGAAGDIEELTGTQATTLLDNFTSALKGLVPLSGGGTTNYLRADGTWTNPIAGIVGVTDGDKGDITVSGTGATWTIDNDVVTFAKFQNATGFSIVGKSTTGSGDNADIVAAADEVLRRSGSGNLVFGSLVTNNYSNDSVTYAKIQNVTATSRFLGRITASAGDVEELTGTQATTLLDNFTSALKGLVPLSGGGTTNFLRADGTWAVPVDTNTGHVIRVDGSAQTQRAALNLIDTADILVTPTDDAGGGETELRFTFATVAANTFAANATAGVAAYTPISVAAESIIGRTSGNIDDITSSAQSILLRAAGSLFFATAAADQTLRRSGSGDLGFGTLVTNNIGDDQVSNAKLDNMAANTIKVNATTGSANPTDMAMATNTVALRAGSNVEAFAVGTNTVLGRVGGNIVAAQLVNAQVTDNTLQYSKLLQTSRRSLLGNSTSATANVTGQDQAEIAQILALPSEVGTHVICWEDEDFNYNLKGATAFTTITSATHNKLHTVTGHNGKWLVTAATANGAWAWEDQDPIGHNGVLILESGTSINSTATLYFARDQETGGNGEACFDFDDFISADFYIMIPVITNVLVRVGMGTNLSSGAFGTDSVYAEYSDAGGSTWDVVTRAASTGTTTDTGFTVVAGNWIKITFNQTSGEVEFYINNVLEATHSTNVPSADMTMGVMIGSEAAAGKDVHIDRIRLFLDDAAMIS